MLKTPDKLNSDGTVSPSTDLAPTQRHGTLPCETPRLPVGGNLSYP